MRIAGYSYQAANYHSDCVIKQIIQERHLPIDYDRDEESMLDMIAPLLGIENRMDDHSFDSDDFPKVIFATQIEDEEFCDRCHDPID